MCDVAWFSANTGVQRLAARAAVAIAAALWLAAATGAALAREALSALPEAPARSAFDAAAVTRGANLAAIGNCAACHTAAAGAPYAGGLALQTPFGTVYSSNLTPAPQGLGEWSREAFVRAMRDGVSRDGHLLYPAFPYDHFTHAADDDLAALYAFVMTRTPEPSTPPPNRMRFPFGWRPLIAAWNALFLDRRPFEPDPAHDAAWNRGAYLSVSLAHCGACHTPRNALGAERRSAAYAGGDVEGWYAPPLDADSPSPQPWTVDALTEYLRTGITARHAIAGGPMQGVTAALGTVDEADVRAIATYVVTLIGPGSESGGQRAARTLALAAQPLAVTPRTDDPQQTLGASVYADACARCHEAGRKVSSDGALQMPLAVAVHDADPRSLLRIVRDGITPPDGARGRVMPGFGNALTDEQLTALAAYLRLAAAQAPPWPDLPRAVHESRAAAEAKETR